ncbi:protein of unknown function [Methylacidimicrobium sp. AP8]|nr:protein of unknown function [Methylacidimicrobium sp. AP8]
MWAGSHLAAISHKLSPAACTMGLSASLSLGFLAILAVCRPTAPGENLRHVSHPSPSAAPRLRNL